MVRYKLDLVGVSEVRLSEALDFLSGMNQKVRGLVESYVQIGDRISQIPY